MHKCHIVMLHTVLGTSSFKTILNSQKEAYLALFLFQLENCPLDRKTFIVQQDGGFVINRVITQGEVTH